MCRSQQSPLRRSLSLAYANGALWGAGSGLASVSLVAYFARELHASGAAVGRLVATAHALVAPSRGKPAAVLRGDVSGERRGFGIAAGCGRAWRARRFSALADRTGFLWALCQALEFIGVVALWSWFGDLAPATIRGRFVGRREAWLTAGLVAGGFAAALATWAWQRHCQAIGQPELLWKSYAACASFGAALAALATLPLARMSGGSHHWPASPPAKATWRDLVAPLLDRRFRRLMWFGLCYSVANGLVQSPRQIFLASILKLELAEKRSLDAASRGLQIVLLPWLGRVVDRRGNVQLLVVSWAIVSLGTLYFLFVTPQAKWWIAGAYVCWVAYAGLNVTLPNLMLGLSPPHATAPYAAAWFAWTQLAYSLSILAGGQLLDWLLVAGRLSGMGVAAGEATPFRLLFAAGVLMAVGVGLARRIPEPGPDAPR